jgi:hypothetical protein
MCLYVLSVKGWGGRENIWTQECACGWMATYPAVLLLDVHDQIAPTVKFLIDVLGATWQDDLPRMLQLYLHCSGNRWAKWRKWRRPS